MFQGFTDRTFEYFMAIGFNNNREFFHENHRWYVESVREPLKDLAATLGDVLESIDPDLERRPEKALARLNRDLRFSRDKSPYRDYLWLGFHNTSFPDSKPGFYADISARGVGWGMGFYGENRAIMNALRSSLEKCPDEFVRIVSPLEAHFGVERQVFKRMKIPDCLPQILKGWYPLRSFSLSSYCEDQEVLTSPLLCERIKEDYRLLKPLYDYFSGLVPAE